MNKSQATWICKPGTTKSRENQTNKKHTWMLLDALNPRSVELTRCGLHPSSAQTELQEDHLVDDLLPFSFSIFISFFFPPIFFSSFQKTDVKGPWMQCIRIHILSHHYKYISFDYGNELIARRKRRISDNTSMIDTVYNDNKGESAIRSSTVLSGRHLG